MELKDRRIQILLYTFAYYKNINNGGATVMHYFAKIINDLNHKNFYAKIYTIDNKYYENDLCNEYLKRGEEIDYENTIVIYYENIVNPLNAKHIVRWMDQQILNDIIYYDKNDLIYFLTPYQNNHFLQGYKNNKTFKQLCCLYYNNIFYNKNKNHERIDTCVLFRKSWLYHKDVQYIHPSNSIVLDNLSLEEIVEVFNKCKYFYCYDPFTTFIVYAVACGCITIIYPRSNISKDEYYYTMFICFDNKIYNSGIAYGNSDEEIKFATDTLAEGEFMYKELFESYKNTVYDLIKDLEIYFKEN